MSSLAITNAHVFDGMKNFGIKTIVSEDGEISDKTSSDATFDDTGCTLLPGLIANISHPRSVLTYYW